MDELKTRLGKYLNLVFLCAHVYLSETGERLVIPYVSNEAAGTNAGNTTIGSHTIGFQDVKKDQETRNIVISFEIVQDHLYDALVEIQKLEGQVDRSLFE